jgi:transposase
MIGFSNRKSQLSYERTNFSELVRELSISAPLLYQWRKEYEEFGQEVF